jgi:hypothetical protein
MKKGLNMVLVVLFFLVIFCPAALAEDKPSGGLQAVDLILVRPVSLGVSLVSTGFLACISPLVYLTGVSEPAMDILLVAPWRFTGCRYLEDFGRYKDEQPIMILDEKI